MFSLSSNLSVVLIVIIACFAPLMAQLNPHYYDKLCPEALPNIKRAVEKAVAREPRMGASLLRLHFHDCFVNLGGRPYNVQLGRRDALTASRSTAIKNIPSPLSNFKSLLSSFQSHGLNLKDLILLSSSHTIGFARCATFRSRIYNESNAIDASFAISVRSRCPASGGDDNLSPLDSSSKVFDAVYFRDLVKKRGLLHSDQELYKGDGSAGDKYVEYYSENDEEFWRDFGASMLKLGNISPLRGFNGEIRKNCRKVNS